MDQKFTQLINSKLNSWHQQLANYTPNIVAALLAFLLFFILAKILKKYIYKAVGKFIRKNSLKRFSASFVRFLIISIGILAALSILNLGGAITSLLTWGRPRRPHRRLCHAGDNFQLLFGYYYLRRRTI